MNILIVDDDKYVIEGVVNGVTWDSLPIENVYTAIGSYQARNIFAKIPVHILLCDIEIPYESGLELVEWIRDQGFQTHVIFFTSYADFHYAQKAIQLGSFEYVLKPIAYEQLTDIILRTTEAVEKEAVRKKYQEMGQYWMDSQQLRKENFWYKLLTRHIALTKEEVYERVEKLMLEYTKEHSFLILSADIAVPNNGVEKLEQGMYVYKISNLLEDCFLKEGVQIEAIWQETLSRWYSVIRLTNCEKTKQKLPEYGRDFLEAIDQKMKKEGSLYFSEIVTLEEAYEQMTRIKEMRFHNIGFREGMFFAEKFKRRQVSYQKPDMNRVELLFSLGDKSGIKKYIDEYLRYHAEFYEFNMETLQSFMFDIMQSIFSMLREKQIEAHQLFSDSKTRQYYEKALESISDMEKYVYYLFDIAIDYRSYMQETENVIDKMVKYIEENLDKNITRADLAQLVYLNADYMSRMFKEEKGVSLVAYITTRRMEKAKQLLLTTNESIYSIASKTGYVTSSYFAKKFKEYYGVAPAEYKAIRQQ